MAGRPGGESSAVCSGPLLGSRKQGGLICLPEMLGPSTAPDKAAATEAAALLPGALRRTAAPLEWPWPGWHDSGARCLNQRCAKCLPS